MCMTKLYVVVQHRIDAGVKDTEFIDRMLCKLLNIDLNSFIINLTNPMSVH